MIWLAGLWWLVAGADTAAGAGFAGAAAGAGFAGELAVVSSYTCEGTYLEGEGVSPYMVSCEPFQRLGFLKARHTNYLFSTRSENNFGERAKDKDYSGSICGRHVWRRKCSGSGRVPRFGLARRSVSVFVVPIILSPAGNDVSRVYGYAAPLVDGQCAAGLVRASWMEAVPLSIVSPLPSSFENFGGNQNDRVISVDGLLPSKFLVWREANTVPCDANGNCSGVEVGEAEIAQVAEYRPVAGKADFCVIPVGR